MKKLYRRFKKVDDRGAALALVGSALVLLMGMAAFGTDLAWFYLNSSRIQRAADAAALGGVVHLPTDEATAKSNAQSVAVQNGYTDGENATVIPEVDSDDPNLGTTELRVTIRADVPTFFLKVFGWNSQTITQTGTAEYFPPLPLGSPEDQFGDSPGCWPGAPAPTGPCNNFWASIQGHRNGRGWGDYFSSLCQSWQTCTTQTNPDYRSRGYLYAVDVPAGVSSFTVDLLNPAFRPEGGGGANPMEERFIQGSGWSSSVGPPHVSFTLYEQTPTPLDLSSTTPVGGSCTQTYPPSPWPGGNSVTWQTHCTVNGPSEGIYPLQVRIPPSATRGHARFSIRATASGGPAPSVYALGDMSIYTATEGVTEFFLADVQPHHAGKTLVIELWDAGDAGGTPELQPLGPGGSTFDCEFTSTNPNHSSIAPGCSKVTRFGGDTVDGCFNCFNNRWMTFRIELPFDYTCTDCWWKMRYSYPPGFSVTDTTTWRAYIEGNPIHLVPNE